MTSFLSWIYAQAAKIYDWFGSGYNTFRNAAANAWNWAVTKSNEALNAAKQYAYQLFQLVGNVAGLTVDWVLRQIQNVRNGLLEDIAGLFDWAEYQIELMRGYAQTIVNNVINGVYAYITSVSDWLQSIIQSGMDWVVDWVSNGFGWALSIRDRLLQILSVINIDTLQLLINFAHSWLQTIILFFQNPLGFIFDVIQEKFVSFLCYVLAWSLGTTKYDLPSAPPWKGR